MNIEIAREFLEWCCANGKLGSSKSLFQIGKNWRMAFHYYLGYLVDESIKVDMKNVRQGILVLPHQPLIFPFSIPLH
jgi:hypothetical protein